jgi:hypothetical protein
MPRNSLVQLARTALGAGRSHLGAGLTGACRSNPARLALLSSAPLLSTAQPCVLAQSAPEATRDLSDIQSNDPQGFTWMLICIGIIMTAAITLITVTTVLAMKGKKSA